MTYAFNSLLGRLVGYRLYSVQFVLDYVQLHFDIYPARDMPLLTCEVMPTVVVDERQISPTEAGWADALRTHIGQEVTATREAPCEGLRIDLATGSIQLRPTEDELVGPEIAILNGFEDRSWTAWRPAEEAFEYL